MCGDWFKAIKKMSWVCPTLIDKQTLDMFICKNVHAHGIMLLQYECVYYDGLAVTYNIVYVYFSFSL